MIKLVFTLITVVLLCRCTLSNDNNTTESNDVDITGYYGLDKYVVKDTSKKILTHYYLNLEKDKTFILSNVNGDVLTGNWKVIKSGDDKKVVQFNIQNRSIQGELRGTIIYFEYPNDFYSGYYERVLYVKLNRIPEELSEVKTKISAITTY